jgi:uncharacterized protein
MLVRALIVAAVALAACKSERAPETAPVGSAGSASAPVEDPWNAAPKPRPAPTAEKPFVRPMLWTATKDGKVMHLFGTLHVGVDVTKRLPLWIWRTFDTATVLVQELDIHEFTNSIYGNPPSEGRSLRADLGEARWKTLVAHVPTVVATMLDQQSATSAALTLGGRGSRPADLDAIPMDADFLVRAREQAKALVFLETPQFQGGLFKQNYDLAALETLIDNVDKLADVNRDYFEHYIRGDADAFYATSLAQFRLGVRDDAGLQALLESLLFARNRAWIPQLEKVHAAQPSGGVFVTVGVLHLLGPDNVLDLLAKRGFTIAAASPP